MFLLLFATFYRNTCNVITRRRKSTTRYPLVLIKKQKNLVFRPLNRNFVAELEMLGGDT